MDGEEKPPSEGNVEEEESDSEEFPEEGLKGEDLEWIETRVYSDEDQETISLKSSDSDVGLHSKFIDLSLENDLKGEELEWFKSRICPVEVEAEEEKEEDSVPKKVQILTEADLEERDEKSRKLILRLRETNTLWFFSLETKYCNAEDAEKIRREDELYLMKKSKIEYIRKRCMADSQTPRFMEKTVGTLTTPINKADAAVFASEWDLFDTYTSLDKCELAPSGKYFKFTDPAKTSAKSDTAEEDYLTPEERAYEMFKSLDFKYASLVTERLLAANCFQPEQLVFKTDFKTRYDTEPSTFSYKMEELWDFKKDLEHPLFVTAMDWNPLNQDLIAVSYGDLQYEGKSIGLICVWSPKNPRQPEREFHFPDSITSLHYSKVRPNILAFGTRKGNVYITDISVSAGKVTTLTSSKTHPGPVWKVEWFLHKELTFESEKLLAVGESGVLMLFFPGGGSRDILKLDYVTTTKNLPETLPKKKLNQRPFIQEEIYDKKTFSGLYFSIFSDRNFCYIATKEGPIIKCNLRNPSMTDGIFLGHDGPVYIIEHSPVTDLVFLTCGADWKIKIWMEGITEPLITLHHTGAVAFARWSPTIPTIIASVSEYTLAIWDIARNVTSPMSVKNFENLEHPLSTLLFSANGANLILGSQNGIVRVVHLSELPRIPFLQKEALVAGLKNALEKKESELLGRFLREVKVNKEKLKTKIV